MDTIPITGNWLYIQRLGEFISLHFSSIGLQQLSFPIQTKFCSLCFACIETGYWTRLTMKLIIQYAIIRTYKFKFSQTRSQAISGLNLWAFVNLQLVYLTYSLKHSVQFSCDSVRNLKKNNCSTLNGHYSYIT